MSYNSHAGGVRYCLRLWSISGIFICNKLTDQLTKFNFIRRIKELSVIVLNSSSINAQLIITIKYLQSIQRYTSSFSLYRFNGLWYSKRPSASMGVEHNMKYI